MGEQVPTSGVCSDLFFWEFGWPWRVEVMTGISARFTVSHWAELHQSEFSLAGIERWVELPTPMVKKTTESMRHLDHFCDLGQDPLPLWASVSLPGFGWMLFNFSLYFQMLWFYRLSAIAPCALLVLWGTYRHWRAGPCENSSWVSAELTKGLEELARENSFLWIFPLVSFHSLPLLWVQNCLQS